MDAGAVYVDVVEDGVLGVDDGESPKPHTFSILSLRIAQDGGEGRRV